MKKPDFLFEVSWEACNKIGGVHTVLTSKAAFVKKEMGDNYIIIGPDVWKETHSNPNFIEDHSLFASWREMVKGEGLNIRIGRSTAVADTIAILVDFTSFFSQKDKILTGFWEKFGLDSLSGQWDYVEPALFGYASGKVIESFYQFYFTSQHSIVAHFHEWMSGAGVLYLKERVPLVASVFGLHASVMGRSISAKGWDLYGKLSDYNAELLSHDFGVAAKNSLEKTAAAQTDILSVPSALTGRESEFLLNRKADVILPNGFAPNMVPSSEILEKQKNTARNLILEVASAQSQNSLSSDTLILGTACRYEFHNKGIDLLIDALANLNQNYTGDRDILMVMAVTADNMGPCTNLVEKLHGNDVAAQDVHPILTHELTDFDHDPILQRLQEKNLNNSGKVKLMFVPAFLDRNDGIFNLDYTELLTGFDFSIFPSNYEPWGYTPLESSAFHIPTLTTNLSGFGQWLQENVPGTVDGIHVIDRQLNDDSVVGSIVGVINEYLAKDKNALKASGDSAAKAVARLTWDNLIKNYFTAYEKALVKVSARAPEVKKEVMREQITAVSSARKQTPIWKKVLVKPTIPIKLMGLNKISRNLWWTWNTDAAELFKTINHERWNTLNFNPIALLESLSSEEWAELEASTDFLKKLEKVEKSFDDYMSATSQKNEKSIAYFSMEFGLHDTIKIFSGGLGMLAGDHLKEASDLNLNLAGIGLLYRYGYFRQRLTLHGDQVAEYTPQKFSHLPIEPVRREDGSWITVEIALPGRVMFAKVWRVDVGRVPLYLLDADIEENSQQDRIVTHHLYGGDLENRLKQELLLGVGGIRMLDALEKEPNIYHCNEGHAAFIGLERLRKFVQSRTLNFMQALEVVRSSTLFTTHTPVPAGHDSFPEDLLRAYIPHYANRLNISWDAFMNLGRFVPDEPSEVFSMSVLAVNLSQEVNGVSKIHGRVSREMFARLYEGYFPDEIHIGHVTNGVHYPTWTAKSWQKLYKKEFGEEFIHDQSNPEHWKKILNVHDEVVWQTRQKQKLQLVDYLRDRIGNEMRRRQEKPQAIFRTTDALNKDALIIGFARRFATYKRAGLLFTNPERLSKIVNNPDRPVQFVFAGKAHPHDKNGQALIRRIIEFTKMPEFIGKIFFVENYDIELGKYLVRGVDIWLNTPTRPLEASGTSGEKAVMNGVVNFSVLDGWWAEGYRKDAGWAIEEERTYEDQGLQDELDAEQIFNILEDEIVPVYFDQNEKGLSKTWVAHVKNTIAHIAPHFTMKRQLDDYIQQYYLPLFASSERMAKNNYEKARVLAAWKRKVFNLWDGIKVNELLIPESTQESLNLGDMFQANINMDLNGLSVQDVGIEVLFGRKENDSVKKIIYKRELDVEDGTQGTALYTCSFPISRAGVYDFAFRVFPKNEEMAHKQEMKLVKWI